MLTAKTRRTTTPATVPPAMAPVLVVCLVEGGIEVGFGEVVEVEELVEDVEFEEVLFEASPVNQARNTGSCSSDVG